MVRSHQKYLRYALTCGAAALALHAGAAFAQQARAHVHTPAQALEQSLKDVARQTGVNILFTPDSVAGVRAQAVDGDMTAEDAVAKLIKGTRLEVVTDEAGGLVVRSLKVETSAALAANSAQGARSQAGYASGQDAPTVSEIIVTAQKRAEKLSNVPAAVQAIPAQALVDQGAVQLADYVKEMPGLNMVGAAGPGLGEIVIRGITTGGDHSAAVGIYLDDVPFTPSAPGVLAAGLSLDPDLADIDHVEVLEGPQSTLYGANSESGVLKFVTKQPDLNSWSGSVRVDGTQIDGAGAGYGVRGTVNVPLVEDEIGLRVTVFDRTDPGFIENDYYKNRGVNLDTTEGGRIALKAKISDGVDTVLTAMVQNIDQNGPNSVFLNSSTYAPLLGNNAYSSPVRQYTSTKYRSLSDVTTVKLGFATLTNIASFAEQSSTTASDWSELASFEPAGASVAFANTSHSDRYSDELRLTSAPGRIEWLVGGFYTDERDINVEIDTGVNGNGIPLPSSVAAANLYNGDFVPDYDEKAVFGDLTYHLTSQIQATVGVRYSDDSQTLHWRSTGELGVNNVPNLAQSVSNESYLATVSYKPQANTMVYLRAASAFRPGGPNVLNSIEIAGGAPTSYQPDTLWNYELGVKGSLWNGRVAYTADAFDMVWTHLQINVMTDGFIAVGNASAARSDGFEGSVQVAPVSGLSLALKGAYTDARFTAAAPTLGAASGDALPYAPKVDLAAVADYKWLGLGGYTPRVGLTYAYRSDERSAFFNDMTYKIPSLATLDLRAGVDWSRYTALFIIENATNEYGFSQMGPTTGAGTPLGGTIIQPRTFKLSLQARF